MKLTNTLDLPVAPTIVEYSHRFVMELKDPPVMVELGPGHWILFMEPPVIVCVPKILLTCLLIYTTLNIKKYVCCITVTF